MLHMYIRSAVLGKKKQVEDEDDFVAIVKTS